MAKSNFLDFNAYRIKDLIRQKLSQDTRFTDQIFSGSNLDVLIDIIAYMFQSLLYSLNGAAAESMFADTQFYENINRLCNFLGYNPKGCTTMNASFICDNPEELAQKLIEANQENVFIPRYSYIDTGKNDSRGNTIYYSIGCEDIDEFDPTKSYVLYNGCWQLYDRIFTTTGEPWETFELDIGSSFGTNEFIPHGFIDAYVYSSTSGKWQRFKPASQQLFKPNNSINFDDDRAADSNIDTLTGKIYGSSLDEEKARKNIKNAVFNLKLNENKKYVVTFGDGTTGARLPKDSLLYFVYLKSNGPDAKLDVGEIIGQKLMFNKVSMNDDFWNVITQKDNDGGIIHNEYLVSLKNISDTTPYAAEESVNEIRENAPNWFRSGNRLVTKRDYEDFFAYSPTFKSEFKSVLCQNNWDFVTTFYAWLYNLGLKNHGDQRYYLNQNSLIKSSYQTSDPADCNNVYIWYQPYSESNETEYDARIKKAVSALKDLTHECVACKGIPVSFAITAVPDEKKKTIFEEKTNGYAVNDKTTYIEVTMADDAVYSSPAIANQVVAKIQDFFENNYMGLGHLMNFNDLLDSIYSINGVSKIRTVYCEDESQPQNAITYNGLSFISWPQTKLVEFGDDMTIGNLSRQLEDFQYPIFNGGNQDRYKYLYDRIKVVKQTLVSVNAVQY